VNGIDPAQGQGQGQVSGFCELGNELHGSIKCRDEKLMASQALFIRLLFTSSLSSVWGRRYTPNVLQPIMAYCTNPALVSPFHLQSCSTSDGVRDLYQRKVELWARND
jgi:hypothetical protein